MPANLSGWKPPHKSVIAEQGKSLVIAKQARAGVRVRTTHRVSQAVHRRVVDYVNSEEHSHRERAARHLSRSQEFTEKHTEVVTRTIGSRLDSAPTRVASSPAGSYLIVTSVTDRVG